jgi:hypothetical protein
MPVPPQVSRVNAPVEVVTRTGSGSRVEVTPTRLRAGVHPCSCVPLPGTSNVLPGTEVASSIVRALNPGKTLHPVAGPKEH